MKPLTQRQAAACENAKGKTCRCRCGGAFHGQSHGPILEMESATGLPYPLAQYQLAMDFDQPDRKEWE